MMTMKKISTDGCFWFLETYFYYSKCLSRTENHAHTIRCIRPKFVKVHLLNFLYDHNDYSNFDNVFSIIMNNFPKPISLGTKTLLQDGNKSENSGWERDVLNLEERWDKRRRKLVFFQTTLLFNNCKGKCPLVLEMSFSKSWIQVWCFTDTLYCISSW